MAALTAARNTPQMGLGIPQIVAYPVLTGITIYEGAIVVINSSGYAKPGVSEASDVCVGRAMSTIASGASASGTYTINVEQGVFKWGVNGTAVTIASMGALCYVYDDQTVTLSSSSASIAGTIYGIDSDGGAWVYMGLAPAVDGTSLSSLTATVSGVQSTANAAYGDAVGAQNVPITIPVLLSSAVTSAVVFKMIAATSGKIARMDATVISAPTTSSKAASFTPKINSTVVTGCVVATTSTNLNTLGNFVTGSTVSAGNSIAVQAGDVITIVTSGVTSYVEGQILLELFMASA